PDAYPTIDCSSAVQSWGAISSATNHALHHASHNMRHAASGAPDRSRAARVRSFSRTIATVSSGGFATRTRSFTVAAIDAFMASPTKSGSGRRPDRDRFAGAGG